MTLTDTPGDTMTTPTERPMDNTSAVLENLFSDLSTYRVLTQVPVTPAMARRIIALNHDNNRHYRATVGARYARDMAEGRWREKTGQTVVIDTEGRMIGGNHRMHAVDESGVTVKFDLCFGAPPENISVIDNHLPHTASDILRTAGAGDLRGVAPIVRWVWAWENKAYMGTSGKFTPTAGEMLDRYNAEPQLFEAAAARGTDCVRRRLAAGSAAGTAFVLLSHIDPKVTHDFFDAFVSGVNLEEGQAVYELRERLRTRVEKRLRPPHQLALIIRGWNFYNRFGPDGNRVRVQRFTVAKEGKLGNPNFPMPVKVATGFEPDAASKGEDDDA